MLCDDLGANYLTRARNEHAKAGNLNNGLAHSKAPIVVVFDADHVPFTIVPARDRRLLLPRSEAVPRADAARLPQPRPGRAQPADLRPDAVRERDVLRVTQRGLDKWNGVVLLRLGRGAAARGARRRPAASPASPSPRIARRRSSCIRAGWTSVYVDKPLIAGLAARDLRVLHRPALALVPGHVPDLPAEEPAVQARPQADPAALLPLEHDLLVLPAAAPDLHGLRRSCTSSSTSSCSSRRSRN